MNKQIDGDYLVAERYDQYYGAYRALPDWFLNDLAERGDVLELACGSGRIAIPIAEHGINVTGVDYSEPMLSLARQKARDKNVEVKWIHADARQLETGRRYGTILLLANALWHFHTLADFENCIRTVKHHLAPNGLFVLSVFVPNVAILSRDPGVRYPYQDYTDEETGELIHVTMTYRYEPDTQTARSVHYVGDTDEVVGGLNLRMYFPQELEALLRYNGLKIQEKFGDWDRSAFGPGSRHQLCLCAADA